MMYKANKADGRGSQWRSGLLFLAPFLVGMMLFRVWPLLRVISIAFREGYNSLTGGSASIGLGNFREVLTDDVFHRALLNTAVYAICVVPAVLVISLAAAWCLLRVRRGAALFQVLIFLPFVTSDIAIGIAQRILFSNRGIVNHLLQSFGMRSVGWLTDARVSLWTLVVYGIWNGISITTLILYSAMLNIDENLFIAARVGGAGETRIFRAILLPMIRSPLAMAFFYNSIAAWLTINGLFPLFSGQPGPYYNLYTLTYYIYDKAQQGKYGFGVSCAASCVLLLLVGAFLLLRRVCIPKYPAERRRDR